MESIIRDMEMELNLDGDAFFIAPEDEIESERVRSCRAKFMPHDTPFIDLLPGAMRVRIYE